MADLLVYRVVDDKLLTVGRIVRQAGGPTFAYDGIYLQLEGATPLSFSLPLCERTYAEHELRPYFEGLLPEGSTREALAARLGARESDYLTLLGEAGLDCMGDVVVRKETEGTSWDAGEYVPLSEAEVRDSLSTLARQAHSNAAARLSLAGTQGKIGLAHLPGKAIEQDWMLPTEGAASTHILKASNLSRIAEFELICMRAAEACGLRVAHTEALILGSPIICSRRYDRDVSFDEGSLHVRRLHQEDLAQAFGYSSSAKYLELEGGTYHAIAQLLYERSSSVLEDLDQLARIAIFDYLVGNCDNHLKNLSVLHEGEYLRLAPAYDLVCTTFFERFSREMGKRLGSTREIDDVAPDDFALLAKDLGIGTKRIRRLCAEIAERIAPALDEAGEYLADVLPTLPYSAEDLIDDMLPRRAVVSAFAG